MDPRIPPINLDGFPDRREQFLEYYCDAEEVMPFDMPKSRGRAVIMTAYVDASHGANKDTRRSHTGYVVFVN